MVGAVVAVSHVTLIYPEDERKISRPISGKLPLASGSYFEKKAIGFKGMISIERQLQVESKLCAGKAKTQLVIVCTVEWESIMRVTHISVKSPERLAQGCRKLQFVVGLVR